MQPAADRNLGPVSDSACSASAEWLAQPLQTPFALVLQGCRLRAWAASASGGSGVALAGAAGGARAGGRPAPKGRTVSGGDRRVTGGRSGSVAPAEPPHGTDLIAHAGVGTQPILATISRL